MNEEELDAIKRFSEAYRKLVDSIGELKKLIEEERQKDLPTNILLRTFLYYESHYPRFRRLLKLFIEEDKRGMDYVLYRFDDLILKIEKAKVVYSRLTVYRYLSPFLEILGLFITTSELFLSKVFTISPGFFLKIASVYKENKWHVFQALGKKNAIMLHGGFETPDSYWFPSIRIFLENNRYEVWTPQLPDPNQQPYLNKQLPFVLQNGKFNEHTTIIAHSAGCPLTLSVLENINIKIHRAILVAGFTIPIEGMLPDTIVQERYNWDKIRQNVEDVIFINSDDDPWGCNTAQGKYMFDNLGGALIILHRQGHFGSNYYNQPYREFPLLERLLSLP